MAGTDRGGRAPTPPPTVEGWCITRDPSILDTSPDRVGYGQVAEQAEQEQELVLPRRVFVRTDLTPAQIVDPVPFRCLYDGETGDDAVAYEGVITRSWVGDDRVEGPHRFAEADAGATTLEVDGEVVI